MGGFLAKNKHKPDSNEGSSEPVREEVGDHQHFDISGLTEDSESKQAVKKEVVVAQSEADPHMAAGGTSRAAALAERARKSICGSTKTPPETANTEPRPPPVAVKPEIDIGAGSAPQTPTAGTPKGGDVSPLAAKSVDVIDVNQAVGGETAALVAPSEA